MARPGTKHVGNIGAGLAVLVCDVIIMAVVHTSISNKVI